MSSEKVDQSCSQCTPWRRLGGGDRVPFVPIPDLGTRGRWVTKGHVPAAFYRRRRDTQVPTGEEAGWDPEPAWEQTPDENSLVLAAIRTPIVQYKVRHYSD